MRRRLVPLLLLASLVASGCADSSYRTRAVGGVATTTTSTVASAPVAAPAVPAAADGSCAPVLPQGTSQRSIVVAGETRTYSVVVPSMGTAARRLALVVLLHGSRTTGDRMLTYTGATTSATESDTIVVAPDALAGRWRLEEIEVQFLVALVDDLATTACADPARTYVVGMATGAALAGLVACRAGSRFAAYGMVGGSFHGVDQCRAAPAASVWIMHGSADKRVALASSERNAEAWATQDGCARPPVDAVIGADVTTRTWGGCAGQAEVRLTIIQGGGHTWPGSPVAAAAGDDDTLGATTTQIDATAALFTFFAAHRSGR